MLAQQRPQKKPATELLMNFSMMAVWRLGGHVRSLKGTGRPLQRFDEVCGGTWWRDYFADAAASSAKAGAAEDAIEAVAAEYSRRLARRTGMFVQSVPVSHAPHKRAVYGWSSPPAASTACGYSVTQWRARDEWWKSHELREEGDRRGSFVLLGAPGPQEVEDQALEDGPSSLSTTRWRCSAATTAR
ncbi:hypothetical protein [Streptomyces sp. 2231.1]|uniref:hypothetical protein n=1 Tax=Streptomyces sp. 2231.1 TaxID=1855347 RepID=UPI00210C15D0|nr:hypothetical protein [Streptomyces sp. 2231.1]